MLLLAACAWTLVEDLHQPARPWRLGILAGLLQWVRFGPHVVALVGILLITCWQWLLSESAPRALRRRLAYFVGKLLAGYLLTVLSLVGWYFLALTHWRRGNRSGRSTWWCIMPPRTPAIDRTCPRGGELS